MGPQPSSLHLHAERGRPARAVIKLQRADEPSALPPVLHLPGIDHERRKFQGRYYRLTDVHGHVVKSILA